MTKRQIKVYIDTEFKEIPLSSTLQGIVLHQPISVGCFIPLKSRCLHYDCSKLDKEIKDSWLQENLMPNLSKKTLEDLSLFLGCNISTVPPKEYFEHLLLHEEPAELLIISDISGSDSVVFRQFFGGYFELEKLAPIDTIDLYSIAYSRGILDEVKAYRASLVDERYIHNALFDAWLVYKIDEKFKLTP